MKKLLWLCFVGFLACTETSLIGEDFVDDGEFNISMIDSLTLNFSTTKYDSLITSNTGRLVVGQFNHPMLGTIKAESYFLFAPSNTTLPDLDEGSYGFDSATMIFIHDDYEYYDVNDYTTFKVYQLEDDLVLESNGYLYNTSSFAYNNAGLIGQKQVKTDWYERGDLEIRLEDELGAEIYQMIKDDRESVKSNLEFQQYFHGFSLQPSDESPFYGFYSDSVYLRIYYTNFNTSPVSQNQIDFLPVSGTARYTKFSQSGSLFDSVKSLEDEISANETENIAVVSGGVGYGTRVDLPNIRSLLLDGDDFLISYAELRLYPLVSDEEEHLDLPETLTAYIVDQDNNILGDLNENAVLHLDIDLNRDTYYAIEVTELVDYLLTPLTNTSDYAIFLSIDEDNLSQSVGTVMLGNKTYNSKLILYTIRS